MKKILLTLSIILCANIVLVGQEDTIINNIKYEIESVPEGQQATNAIVKKAEDNISGNVSILNSVPINGTNYPVTKITEKAFENKANITSITIPNSITSIGKGAFKKCSGLTSITIPNSVTSLGEEVFGECTNLTSINLPTSIISIGKGAFKKCTNLTSITIPNSVTSLGEKVFEECSSLTSVNLPNSITSLEKETFKKCTNLTNITIPNSVTSFEEKVFSECSSLASITIPESVTSIGKGAFEKCTSLDSIICLATIAPTINNNNNNEGPGNHQVGQGGPAAGGPAVNGPGNEPGNIFKEATQEKTLTILFNCDYSSWINYPNANIRMTYHWIRPAERKELEGEFKVNDTTSLINEGVLKIKQGGQLINETTTNVSGIFEVETTNLTAEQWHLIGLPFTNYKLETLIPGTMELSILEFDYSNGLWSEDWATIDTEIKKGESFLAYSWWTEPTIFTNYGDIWDYQNNAVGSYDFNQAPLYSLNNEDVTVTKTLVYSNEGYWMALANPYTFKLNIATFLSNQSNIQGEVYYRLNDDNETWTVVTSGEINVTEGFFVNFTSGGEKSAIFKKSQRLVNSAKSSNEREFVKLAMIDGNREIEVLFAHNEEAEEGYDIFDANKLFSMSEVTEPYFVTNDKALVKEEVNTLPYYATMNVRSFETKEVSFKLTSLPEGIAVSLIDGEEIIDLNGDIVYTTNITAGENANRFKVLFKKSVGLSDVEDLNIEISNNNRIVNVSSTENNLQIEVYNALGQRVYETKARNFSLNDLTAGAYVVKAFNKSASKTTKIVIH